MFPKVLLLTLLIAVPSLASSEVQKLGLRNEKELMDAVNKLAETARQTVASAIEQLNVALLGTLEDIEKVVSASEKEIDQAKQLGKDDNDCILQQKEKIEKLNQATLAELRKCVGGVISELTKLFEELVQSLNDINNMLMTLIDELYACSNWNCKVPIIKQIAEQVLNVSGVMGDKITRFLAIIRENKEAVGDCVSSNMDSFKLELAKIADELKECLNQ